MSRNYYQLLHVAETADLQPIKKAFHRLSKVLHPDTTVLPANEAANEFHLVCEAYEKLSDPISRGKYDNILKKSRLGNDCYSNKINVRSNLSSSEVAENNTNSISQSELLIQLEEMQEALQNLRFQKSMQQLEDLSQIKKMKKKIARTKTAISQQKS